MRKEHINIDKLLGSKHILSDVCTIKHMFLKDILKIIDQKHVYSNMLHKFTLSFQVDMKINFPI